MGKNSSYRKISPAKGFKLYKLQQAAFMAAFAYMLSPFFKPANISVYAQTPPIVNPTEANTICQLNLILQNILKLAVPLAGMVLFVMLVMGGLSYLTSGGNPEAVKKAQGTITFAIAGISLLALAWIVLAFIKEFTGVDVTVFSVCSET